MKVQDATGGTIKSGGKTRRAAIMQTLKSWHPDIMEFVEAKMTEEKKAWALIEQGYDGSFNGPAYGSVAFQNVNQSVRVDDALMQAVEADGLYDLKAVTSGETVEQVPARSILDGIAEGTHLCGDPGLQYEDTIQKWHTCPNTAPINSSNPCVTGDTPRRHRRRVATDRRAARRDAARRRTRRKAPPDDAGDRDGHEAGLPLPYTLGLRGQAHSRPSRVDGKPGRRTRRRVDERGCRKARRGPVRERSARRRTAPSTSA